MIKLLNFDSLDLTNFEIDEVTGKPILRIRYNFYEKEINKFLKLSFKFFKNLYKQKNFVSVSLYLEVREGFVYRGERRLILMFLKHYFPYIQFAFIMEITEVTGKGGKPYEEGDIIMESHMVGLEFILGFHLPASITKDKLYEDLVDMLNIKFVEHSLLPKGEFDYTVQILPTYHDAAIIFFTSIDEEGVVGPIHIMAEFGPAVKKYVKTSINNFLNNMSSLMKDTPAIFFKMIIKY